MILDLWLIACNVNSENFVVCIHAKNVISVILDATPRLAKYEKYIKEKVLTFWHVSSWGHISLTLLVNSEHLLL